MNNDEYCEYIPDYLLTWGEYWNKFVKIPGKPLVLGNPQFYDKIGQYKTIKERKNTILVVSQGTITKRFVKFAIDLSKSFSDHKIVYKLHPGEVAFEERYADLYNYDNIIVEKSGDIFEFIAKSEIIVLYYSTTVYESLGFKKKIFIFDGEMSKSIPQEIGERFKDSKELIQLIKQSQSTNLPNTMDVDKYFNSNWKKNFENFIEREIGLNLENKN